GTVVEGDGADLGPGQLAEERDAEDRPAGGDRHVGDDGVGAGPEVFDDGDQGDVEVAVGEPVGEAAGHVERQHGLRGQCREVVDQRLGVQVIDGPDPHGQAHHAPPGLIPTAHRYLTGGGPGFQFGQKTV